MRIGVLVLQTVAHVTLFDESLHTRPSLCRIHTRQQSHDVQVRIFVEMDSVQGAHQAAVALNGRYFDQKIISASFFDEQRFENMDLAPRPEELQ
jgi:hypothetical protein